MEFNWILFVLPLLFAACLRGESSDSKAFLHFLRKIDPLNTFQIMESDNVSHFCMDEFRSMVKCNFQNTKIVEIRLENLNLSGEIDTDLLCRLTDLQVVSLAKNKIRGGISSSIIYCKRLTYLNLSSNLLRGKLPLALAKLKHLKSLDISSNHFTSIHPSLKHKIKQKQGRKLSKVERVWTEKVIKTENSTENSIILSPETSRSDDGKKEWYQKWENWIFIVFGFVMFLLITYYLSKKAAIAYEKRITMSLPEKTVQKLPDMAEDTDKEVEYLSELVFFVEEDEKFKLDDLLGATAHLRNQNQRSSLFMVELKNNVHYAIKRLKKVQTNFEDFGKIMKHVGNLKHPNILPLVSYYSKNGEKLLIYKYQSHGSLLDLFEKYIARKRKFPWRQRLSIACGISRGLNIIHQKSNDGDQIPHGNLKLSNILLDKNGEPLIAEYGVSGVQFLKPNWKMSLKNGYTAPEKEFTEEGDIYSYGVILLVLLTGKTVENNGGDLPRWVQAMVREEWTGEVFDGEIASSAQKWAFPLLNVALKCVSKLPENRPSSAQVLEKIEEIINAQEDHSSSSSSSISSEA